MEKRLQTYETDRIVVTFNPNVCVHSAICLRTLPGVFDIQRRQWIRPELAEPDVVAAAIERCPSGALRYRLKPPSSITTLFTGLYDAFNARDVDAVLASFTDDVDWPNGMEGGRVLGHDAVRDYWTRQWTMVNPTVTPTAIDLDDGGRIVVTVRQVVRDLSGVLLSDQPVQHIYELRDGAVVRMDIRPMESHV